MVWAVQFSSGRPAARASALIQAASRCLAPRLEKDTATRLLPQTSPTVPKTRASPRSTSTSRVRCGPRRSSRAAQHEGADDGDDLVEDARCRAGPGGSRPPTFKRLADRDGVGPAEHLGGEVVAHGPLLQRVEGDRDGVLDLVGVVGLGDAQPAEEARGPGARRSPAGRPATRRRRLAPAAGRGVGTSTADGGPVGARCPGARERGPVEGEGVVPPQAARRRSWPRRRAAAGGGSRRARARASAAVRSSASSSSPRGTAGGRSAPVCSPRPV